MWEYFTLNTGVLGFKFFGEITLIRDSNKNPFWSACPKDDTNSLGFGKFDTLLGEQEKERIAIYDWEMRRPVAVNEVRSHHLKSIRNTNATD